MNTTYVICSLERKELNMHRKLQMWLALGQIWLVCTLSSTPPFTC